MPRLRRVDCSAPGLTRRRRGKGFEYIDSTGKRVEDPETLLRIRHLGIPPAWTNVWICSHPRGHLQAVGTDAAGRRQYLYHEVWRQRRDAEKFDHMIEFARSLPALRKAYNRDLEQAGLGRERVLGCAVRLLDRGFFRIGTEGYAEQNQTYGLATMQKKHVRLQGEVILFDYIAKSGKRRIHRLVDPTALDVLSTLKRRRGGGPELLAYKEGRTWVDVKSADINLYIKEITGEEFTAKDFRTWNATVLAAVAVAMSSEAKSKTARKRAITRATQEVAHYLGNTPAVCRASYIDPRVFDRYLSNWTISSPVIDKLASDTEFGELATQGPPEEAVLDLLEDRRDADTIEKIA